MRVAVRRSGLIWWVATAAAVLAAAAVGAGAADAVAPGSRSSARRPVLSAIGISLGVHSGRTSPSALKCPPGSLPGDGVCLYGIAPTQLRVAYDLGPLYKKGIDGAKQTIVIVDSVRVPDDQVRPGSLRQVLPPARAAVIPGYPAGREGPSVSCQQWQPGRLGRGDHAGR